jgi:hypothetical protein
VMTRARLAVSAVSVHNSWAVLGMSGAVFLYVRRAPQVLDSIAINEARAAILGSMLVGMVDRRDGRR